MFTFSMEHFLSHVHNAQCCMHTDIDECSDPSLNNCHSSAVCINTMGGFMCECNPGFQGDGVTCTGK